MKKVLVTLFVLAMFAATASAQVPSKPFNIYGGGGITLPSGDFSDQYKTGFHGTARVGFASLPKMEILLGLDYHTNSLKGDVLDSLILDAAAAAGEGQTSSMILIAADLKLNLSIPAAPIRPFALAGIGLASISISDLKLGDITTEFESESKFFFEFGGGFEFSRSYIQAKYVMIPNGAMDDAGAESTAGFLAVTLGIKI